MKRIVSVRWLVLSVLGSLLVALPAQAGRLVHWRFEPRENRLIFTTASGVQPRAQLLANPTRLVIDLPGTTMAAPSVQQPVGGAITHIRIGQFDRRTTRIVVELAPGYSLDPAQVQVQGLAPTEWVVTLPTPQPLAPGVLSAAVPSAGNEYFQVTPTGFLARFGYDRPREVQVRREGNQIAVDLVGVHLPSPLENETLALNYYGVRSVRFNAVGSGTSAIARLTLELTAESPDWSAALSGFGVALRPEGKPVTLPDSPAPSPRLAQIPVPPPERPDYITVPRSWQQPRRTAVPPPAAAPPPPLPGQNPYTYSARPPRDGRPLVVLDPGHGGRDPGAIGIGGLREVDVVLPISLEVARILEQQGMSVILTRDRDYFVTLEGRTQMANQARADAFVSIHANAVDGQRPEVNGVETYYYSSGRRLAELIQRSILRSVPSRDRGVRQARFYVLRYAAMPSVLVEVGFVTGATDAHYLRQPAYRSQMAQAIARGILEYMQGR